MKSFAVDAYNIRWTSQSENSAASMPCGGCDTGANVWVENDELLLYLDKSGSFDENNQMLKLGRVRLAFSEPILRENFSQTLDLASGSCQITGKGTTIEIWFDVESSACHIEICSASPLAVTAWYESWRTAPRELTPPERTAAASYVAYPGSVTSWPDTVEPEKDGVVFYHRNRNEALLFDFLVRQQHLESVQNQMTNPQKDLTFGGRLTGRNVQPAGQKTGEYAGVPFVAWGLCAPAAQKQEFVVTMYTAQCPQLADWRAELARREARQLAETLAIRANALHWWADLWACSGMEINPGADAGDEGWRIGRNYALFRYMLGCNARGSYPTKFNGGLFTTDPQFSVPGDARGKTPDFRAWGGGSFTAQNQRLVYWGLLKSGDFSLMQPQFNYYKNALHNACLRTKAYWGHDGCSFTEQLENMGLPIGWAWGYPDAEDENHRRPPHWDPTEVRTPWLTYYYSSQLEFSYMILCYHRYTGADIREWISFIEKSVTFYFEHYEMLHFERCREKYRDGKLVITPSTALENHKGAVNPIDAVAGLRSVVAALAELPEYVNVGHYRALLEKLPPLPLCGDEDAQTFAPAESWLCKMGDELPQLYPVFPYEFCHLGSRNRDTGVRTWAQADEQERSAVSWRQGGIFTARLGLKAEAKAYCLKKLDDAPARFPAFWGPGYDWLPDHNWGGSGMIGLQEMLVQQHGDTIYLFPSWPEEWAVRFRLHLPQNRVIEGENKGGAVHWQLWQKTPAGECPVMAKDVKIINCLE